MVRPFADHRAAALALLTTSELSEKEGQFCGGIAYRHEPLSEKQLNWLRILLLRHALPELAQSRRAAL